MANYIEQLEQTVHQLNAINRTFDNGVRELIIYLSSEKFWQDSTVQVEDVMRRLRELRSAATDALFEASQSEGSVPRATARRILQSDGMEHAAPWPLSEEKA